jgi:hypothetical protein
MAQMLEFMDQQIAQPSEQVLYALKNFCFILDFYADHLEKNKLVPKIGTCHNIHCLIILDRAFWAKLRESMESVSFLLLLHNEPQVWTKTLVLLSILCKPVLKYEC